MWLCQAKQQRWTPPRSRWNKQDHRPSLIAWPKQPFPTLTLLKVQALWMRMLPLMMKLPVDEEEEEPPQALPVEPEPAPHTKQASTAPMGGGKEDLRPALLSLLTRMGIEAPEPMDAQSVRRRLGPHVQQQPKDMRLTRLLRLALRLTPDALDQATAVQKEVMTELGGMVDALDAWTKLRLQAWHLPNGHGLLKDALRPRRSLGQDPGSVASSSLG